MTKRPTKPANGVPMPDSYYFQCHWEINEATGQRHTAARVLRWPVDLVKPASLLREYRQVAAWLANPATPKGVRR